MLDATKIGGTVLPPNKLLAVVETGDAIQCPLDELPGAVETPDGTPLAFGELRVAMGAVVVILQSTGEHLVVIEVGFLLTTYELPNAVAAGVRNPLPSGELLVAVGADIVTLLLTDSRGSIAQSDVPRKFKPMYLCMCPALVLSSI